MQDTERSVPDDLRSWAAGSYALEAAVELLIRAFRGQFASPVASWIVQDAPGGTYWLDPDLITPHAGVYSGGERRILALVQALASDGIWLDLGAILAGLDRPHLSLVLASIAHAGGSHQHSEWSFADDGKPTGFARSPSLFPWPTPDLGEGADR